MIDFSEEIFFRTARSGGKGGQHVNKVETMVEAWWSVPDSRFFTEEQKQTILEKLKHHINKEGMLMMKSQESRSQSANKKKALAKMLQRVNQSLLKKKARMKTKPAASVIEKRLQLKKQQGEKKMRRRRDW